MCGCCMPFACRVSRRRTRRWRNLWTSRIVGTTPLGSGWLRHVLQPAIASLSRRGTHRLGMYTRGTSSRPYEVSKLAQIASPFIRSADIAVMSQRISSSQRWQTPRQVLGQGTVRARGPSTAALCNTTPRRRHGYYVNSYDNAGANKLKFAQAHTKPTTATLEAPGTPHDQAPTHSEVSDFPIGRVKGIFDVTM